MDCCPFSILNKFLTPLQLNYSRCLCPTLFFMLSFVCVQKVGQILKPPNFWRHEPPACRFFTTLRRASASCCDFCSFRKACQVDVLGEKGEMTHVTKRTIHPNTSNTSIYHPRLGRPSPRWIHFKTYLLYIKFGISTTRLTIGPTD